MVTVSPIAQKQLENGVGLTHLVNPKARTWTSPTTGQTFKLKPISLGLMNRIRSDISGKPKIPTIKVNYGGEWGEEPNPNDPIYLEALAQWNTDVSNRTAIFLFTAGIDISVPGDYRAEVEQYQPGASDLEVKYYFITTLIPSAEYDSLTNALLGQTAPTEVGIAEATAGFPGSS